MISNEAKCKNIFDGKWRMFNDEHVNVIPNPEEEVGEDDETRKLYRRTPYLLFYVQRKSENKIRSSQMGNINQEDYYDLLGCYNENVNEQINEIISQFPRDTTMNSVMDDDDDESSTTAKMEDHSEIIEYSEMLFNSCDTSSILSITNEKPKKKKTQATRRSKKKRKGQNC
jgi:hypothetical protein